jgi:hypothetical protein
MHPSVYIEIGHNRTLPNPYLLTIHLIPFRIVSVNETSFAKSPRINKQIRFVV